MPRSSERPHVVVIGGGFTGLAAAFELTLHGIRTTVLEKEGQLGGLARSFSINGKQIEQFYHHWFTSDEEVLKLARELKVEDRIVFRPVRTGIYYGGRVFKLSNPIDLLRFSPLNLVDRLRLGRLTLRVRRVKQWRDLESLTAKEWLIALGGSEVYRVVWEPLLRGKFGPHAGDIGAVWFWNKIKLRGGSRSRQGGEVLAYFRGGFSAFVDCVAAFIEDGGGRLLTGTQTLSVAPGGKETVAVHTVSEVFQADAVIITTPLPIAADLLEAATSAEYIARIKAIEYLANVCVVLELDRRLSDIYWLNVNDPGFPFVGVIEHTNFEPPESYGGRHIVYLSKYLPESSELYRMGDRELYRHCLVHLGRIFPGFTENSVLAHHIWRARYAQPIVTRHYSRLVPPAETPLGNVYLATMAQIYPEDRGTNYAIRDGRRIARRVSADLIGPAAPRTPQTQPFD